jgi:hypothetical protein
MLLLLLLLLWQRLQLVHASQLLLLQLLQFRSCAGLFMQLLLLLCSKDQRSRHKIHISLRVLVLLMVVLLLLLLLVVVVVFVLLLLLLLLSLLLVLLLLRVVMVVVVVCAGGRDCCCHSIHHKVGDPHQ